MSHLDDGIIAELIDGELDEAARSTAKAHLDSCPECRARYDEAVSYSAESDRLIGAVELPRPARPLRPRSGRDGSSRRIPWRALGWAASIVMAAGIGYYAGVPHPGSPVPGPVSQEQATRQTAEGDADRPALNRGATDSPRQDARAAILPRASVPSDTEARRQLAGKRPGAPTTVAPLPSEEVAQLRERAELPAAEGATLGMARDRSARGNEPSEAKAAAAPSVRVPGIAPTGAVSMEGAINRLGGSIRLIDGMEPVAVRSTADSGAGVEGVRVVYLDPPARELWLDQRRIPTTDEFAGRAGNLLVGDTIASVRPDGRRALDWRDPAGFHLSLSGYLPLDSLHVLARRVR